MLTVGSLFAGIGGFDLGLERAGMQVKWQVEIDSYCLKVLEKHWPHVKRYTDITTVRWEEVEPVDLVCGGFPCQPVSVAGKRKGTADERWLWPEFVRCLGVLRPRYVLIENVPGLLTANRGRSFAELLRDLAACGYNAEWDCLPASAFGAPHWRDRMWFIAYSGEVRCDTKGAEQSLQGLGAHGEAQETSDANRARFSEQWRAFAISAEQFTSECRHRWETEPNVCRMDDGVPNRVDRIASLGNAVVPQVVEWIGRRIMEANKQ